MRELMPFLFLLLSIVAFVLNIFGLMRLIPLYFTLPLLFLSVYFTIYTFTHKRMYRGMR
ncbi:hypothetical protein KQI49_16965 [Virgibacillus sp. MSJ-26]|uniref:hypothetical protein n=1 Tax=Virgibacillus sp. MSJ-26 TaxID=2841522 RepID=UPI001C0F4E96|nr:hypothetical protein [Virgibacillus sp. MSJ-26]MBU5468515.1 hypothetical protein [Virgibacillus sp. MSJ-26]